MSGQRLKPSAVPGLFSVAGTRNYVNADGEIFSKRQYDKARRGGISNESYARLNRSQKTTVLEQSTKTIFPKRQTRLVSELLRPKSAGASTAPRDAASVAARQTGPTRKMLDAAFRSGSKPNQKTKERFAKLSGLDYEFWDDYFNDFEWERDS